MATITEFLQRIHTPPVILSAFNKLAGMGELFLLLAFLAVVLYGLSVGRTRAAISLLSIYAAFTLTVLFPFFEALRKVSLLGIPDAMLRVVVFLGLYVIVFLVLNGSALRSRLSTGDMSFLGVLFISIFQVGLLSAIILFLMPSEKLPGFINPVFRYFGSDKAVFLWASAALAALAFMRSGRRYY